MRYPYVLAPLFEWLPIHTTGEGKMGSIAGLLIEPRKSISLLKRWTGISSILASISMLALVRRAGPSASQLGGAVQLILSAMGLFTSLFTKSGLLIVEDWRGIEFWDGITAGLIQGLSGVGFSGSGTSCAVLMASGLNFEDAAVLSGIAALPLIPMSVKGIEAVLAPFVALAALLLLKKVVTKVAPTTASLVILASTVPSGVLGTKALLESSLGTDVGRKIAELTQRYGAKGLFWAMVLQSIVSVIPADPFLIAAGAFGVKAWEVALFAGSGMAVGALANFYIARAAGRPIVERIFRREVIDRIDVWFSKWGIWAIVVIRLIPFTPIDLISYVAGLSRMRAIPFFFANLFSVMPRVVFFSFLGTLISRREWELVLVVVAALVMALVYLAVKRKR